MNYSQHGFTNFKFRNPKITIFFTNEKGVDSLFFPSDSSLIGSKIEQINKTFVNFHDSELAKPTSYVKSSILFCKMFTGTIFVFLHKQDSAGERANKIFRELDINGDGELDEDEFVKGCLDDGDLMRLLNSGGLDRRGSEDPGN